MLERREKRGLKGSRGLEGAEQERLPVSLLSAKPTGDNVGVEGSVLQVFVKDWKVVLNTKPPLFLKERSLHREQQAASTCLGLS